MGATPGRKPMRRVMACLAAPAVLLTSGCAPDPYPAPEAVAHYEDVLFQARTILEATGIEWEDSVYRPSVVEEDGRCVYNTGSIRPVEQPEPWAVLRHPDFESVMLPQLNQLLTDNGFSELGDTTVSGNGGWRTATDDHGATFELWSDIGFRIDGVVVDAEPCTPEALGLPA